MNILHLSAVTNWGGGENHIENLCLELKQLAPEVNNTVFCNKNGLLIKKIDPENQKVYAASLSFKLDPRYFFNLIRICKAEKIDLIHIHDTTALTLAVMGDYFYNLPPFILSKKTSFPIKPRKRTLFKYNYPKIKSILCVSKATAFVTRKIIIKKEKIVCIYHGTNIKISNPTPNFNLRENLNIPENTFIIGNIANHIRAKSLETLIKVLKELVEVHNMQNFHVVQIGAFTNRTGALKQMVKDYNLQNHISFLDHFPRASALIPQFDISVMTSQSEGLPQFIYESLYHQIPVVSTDVGGISEIIEHNQNGLLATAHDPIELARHIINLYKNPEIRKKFTTNSRQTIQDNFTSEIMALKTLEIYKQVIYGSA